MKFLRFLFFPFAICYGIITWLRNLFYDVGIFKSTSFSVPTIVVGNLSLGGTGKSPHIEYLLKLFHSNFKVATLSRGYGRKTKGFKEVLETSIATEVGDEPLQFKNKFKDVNVFVSEDRVGGIKNILKKNPQTEIILLDDAFQHRALKAGFYILLTEYEKLFCDDSVVPVGSLREFKSGYKRANVIVVTKCPKEISEEEKKSIIKKINPTENQKIYFSSIVYRKLVSQNLTDAKEYKNCLLFSGIANSNSLKKYLKSKFEMVEAIDFPDHHNYSAADFEKIKSEYQKMNSDSIIITTEKDWMRIKSHPSADILKVLPLFYLLIEIEITSKELFNKNIIDYVKANTNNS